jgi:hypothetical protein
VVSNDFAQYEQICAGHPFVHNLHRGHYQLAVELDPNHRLLAALTEFALTI